jgi:two-component system chemotaxis response regulator CheY
MVMPKPEISILIVDDFPTMRKIVKSVLKQLGYQNVAEAEDGQIALNMLKNNPSIEFVVSDWNMPNMTGIELLKAVRADAKLKHLPFLMVTAEADKDNIVEAVKSGVNNYIVKPFNAATMKEKIDKVFKK